MYIRSRAPLRISFAGGGTDISPYYSKYGGIVLNSTIDRYASVTIKPTKDDNVVVRSINYNLTINYKMDEEFDFHGDKLDLIRGVIYIMRKKFGLKGGMEILIQSDVPPGSGLGSSSAVCVALIGALSEWMRLPLTLYEIAELAFEIERVDVGIKGGRQDQYATTFGGFNFMEFDKDQTIINSLKLFEETIYELQYSLIIAYIGGNHNSVEALNMHIENEKHKNDNILKVLNELKKITIKMKNALVTGKLDEFGKLLDDEWRYKKQMTVGISDNRIDAIYKSAIDAGALGGKVSGAGGGGYIFFFADFDKKYSVINALKSYDAKIVNFSFTNHGLKTWRVGKR